jgi:hypothetical protein
MTLKATAATWIGWDFPSISPRILLQDPPAHVLWSYLGKILPIVPRVSGPMVFVLRSSILLPVSCINLSSGCPHLGNSTSMNLDLR